MSLTTIQQQQTLGGQTTDWSTNLLFNQFDPATGLLQDINVGLVGSVSGWIALQNLDGATATFTAALQDTISVAAPGGLPLLDVSPTASATVTLGAFDGSANFIGSSGTVLTGLNGTASAQTTLQAGTVGVSGFVGTGDVALPVTSSGSLFVTGPANMDVLSHATAGATITLDYSDDSGGATGSDGGTGGSVWTIVTPPLFLFEPGAVTTATQSFTFADQTTGWTHSLAAAQFDPTLGRLFAVNITLSNDILASVAAENLGTGAGSLSTTQTADATLGWPGLTGLLSSEATVTDGMTLGAYDGTTNFAGSSGRIDQGLTQAASGAAQLLDPADLAKFEGQGSVALSVGVSDSATLQGPANLSAQLLAQGGATVSISYTYVPAPDLTDAGNGVTYVAGSASVAIDPGLTIGDSYDATLSGAQVSISGGAAGDLLSAVTAGTGITAAYDPGSETLTLSGSAGIATYQQVLRSVGFASSSADPSNGGTDTTRRVQWTVTDDQGATSAPATSTVLIPALPAQWASAISGDFGNGADWTSSPTAPTAAQDVVISQAGTYTIDISSAQTVHSLVLDAPGAVLRIDAPLTVLAGFTVLAGNVEVDGGSLSVGSFTMDGGSASGSSLAITAQDTVALNGGTLLTAATVSASAVITDGSVPITAIVSAAMAGDGGSSGIVEGGSGHIVQVLPPSTPPAMQFISTAGAEPGVSQSGASGSETAGGFGFASGWVLNEQTGVVSAVPDPILSGIAVQSNGVAGAGAGGALWFLPPMQAGPPPGTMYG